MNNITYIDVSLQYDVKKKKTYDVCPFLQVTKKYFTCIYDD